MLPNKKGSLPRATADVYRTIEVDISAMKKTAKKPWTTVHHKERKDYP